MFKSILLVVISMVSISAYAGDSMISVKSEHNVQETTDRLENVLKEKGMNVFARIDHAAGAKKAGKELRPTQLLIFGNPKVGTPLMLCAQSVAIDLPQKALIWEDEKGHVWLGYNNPEYLKARHDVQGCDPVIEKIKGALENFAKAATSG